MGQKQVAVVLHADLTLDQARREVSELPEEIGNHADDGKIPERNGKGPHRFFNESENHHAERAADRTADKAGDGLIGRNVGRELFAAERHAAEHGRGISHKGDDKRHQHQNPSSLAQIRDAAVHNREHDARKHAQRNVRKRHGVFFSVRQNGNQAQRRQQQKRRDGEDDLR